MRSRALAFWCASAIALLGCSDAGEGDATTDTLSNPFIERVVSFTPGDDASFGHDQLPDIVKGPPKGAGACKGSLDAVSLGVGGEIVVEMGRTIVDGPGPDFVVFENAFIAGCRGDESQVYAEPGEVSVSEDGTSWHVFPCTATEYPYGSCAGWRPVHTHPDGDVSPFDLEKAGGDAFDLAEIGVERARFVRIRDMGSAKGGPPSAGFDLDAIAVLNGADSGGGR